MFHISDPLTLKQLREIETITPDRASWKYEPVPHFVIAETLLEQCKFLKLKVKAHAWGVTGKGNARLIGCVDIDNGSAGFSSQEMGVSVGVVQALDLRTAIRIVMGGKVFICSNGMVIGEEVLTKRHTSGLNLSEEIGLALSLFFNERMNTMHDIIAAYKETVLNNSDAARLILNTARQGVIAWSALKKVDALLHDAKMYKDFGEALSLWRIYNTYTQVYKDIPIDKQQQNLRRLMPVINEFNGLSF